jgi:6-phosphogluconolactonase
MTEVVVASDAWALARHAAANITALIENSLKRADTFSIALAGGSTPQETYQQMAQVNMNWNQIEFFFGDERDVPQNDPQNNYRTFVDTWQMASKLPANIHRIQTELGPQAAAADYERLVKQKLGKDLSMDLILLGMGGDGHTASLFPETTALQAADRLVIENFVTNLDMWRITMTLPLINRAKQVYFLVTGKEKAEAIQQVIEGAQKAIELPAQLIQPKDGNLVWLLDAGAASELSPDAITRRIS